MDTNRSCDSGLECGGGSSLLLDCLSSEIYRSLSSSNAVDTFFSSTTLDPHVSLAQNGEIIASSPMSSFDQIENKQTGRTSHLFEYLLDQSFVDLAPNLPGHFNGGYFSETVSSFPLPRCGQIADSDCHTNHSMEMVNVTEKTLTSEHGSENCAPIQGEHNISDEETSDPSTNAKRRKRVPTIESQLAQSKKDDCPEGGKEDFIHVRAKRGQASNSHSIAERVRREKINERMKFLQDLVPGCNKITGKAVMLDEIINYVQSLQRQVEFLSIKLASVHPELKVDIQRFLSKDVHHSQDGSAAVPGFDMGKSSCCSFLPVPLQGSLPAIHNSNFQSPPMLLLPSEWDSEIQSINQIGFTSN